LCQSIRPTLKSEPTFGGSPGLKALFILASRRRRASRRRQNERAASFPDLRIIRSIPILSDLPGMEFDRNLWYAIDLNNFPEFSHARLWTLGICHNARMIRARTQIRSGTREQAFLNHVRTVARDAHGTPHNRSNHGPPTKPIRRPSGGETTKSNGLLCSPNRSVFRNAISSSCCTSERPVKRFADGAA
jgi:hypothetical protein